MGGLLQHTPKVLLVEDNVDDAELIERAFRRAGIMNPLRIVDDAETAMAYLVNAPPFEDHEQNPQPVVMLLDLKLPRKSGFDVLQWMRGQDATRRLPVVVLTSSNQQSDVRRAYDLGANSYLVKPVESDALVDMVRALNLYWVILNQGAE